MSVMSDVFKGGFLAYVIKVFILYIVIWCIALLLPHRRNADVHLESG